MMNIFPNYTKDIEACAREREEAAVLVAELHQRVTTLDNTLRSHIQSISRDLKQLDELIRREEDVVNMGENGEKAHPL